MQYDHAHPGERGRVRDGVDGRVERPALEVGREAERAGPLLRRRRGAGYETESEHLHL